MGYQQGQGRVVGGRTAWPSLAGRQLFDLAGSGAGVHGSHAFPWHAERVAAGVSGQRAVDARGEVEDFLRVQHAQQAVSHDLHRHTRQCPLFYGQGFPPGYQQSPAECDPGVGDVVAGARLGEGLQGTGGEFPGAAGVAVAQQELCARVPYLRAFQGFAEAFRELFADSSEERPDKRYRIEQVRCGTCQRPPDLVGSAAEIGRKRFLQRE
jgi:hypothetical protein